MAAFLQLIFMLFYILIIARVLMSWVQVDPYHPAAQFIYQATEPLLKPIRDLLPPMSGIDFSPIVLLIVAQIVMQIILSAVS